jgi:hypothetical protein
MWNQTHDEVREHTLPSVNRRIDAAVETRVAHLLERDDPKAISRCISQLERCWDVERAFSAATGALALVGSVVARRAGGGWWWLPATAGVLLLEQTFRGGSVLMSALRQLRLRTRAELDLEKFALKGLRGDFTRIPHEGGPEARANAALVAAQS